MKNTMTFRSGIGHISDSGSEWRPHLSLIRWERRAWDERIVRITPPRMFRAYPPPESWVGPWRKGRAVLSEHFPVRDKYLAYFDRNKEYSGNSLLQQG